MNITPYKAVIFDLDGTLIDSLADIACATNHALAECGYPQHPEQAYRHFVGNGIRRLIERSMPPEERTEERIARCHRLMADRYRQCCTERTRLYDGVAGMLDALTAAGLKMAVLSNKPGEFVAKIVSALLWPWPFEGLLGGDGRFPAKPDPQGALWLAGQMGVAPGEVVFVGDSNVDMRTAAAAGMYGVGACWGFRDRDELLAAGARRAIGHPGELL